MPHLHIAVKERCSINSAQESIYQLDFWASAPEGVDVPCPHHLDIFLFRSDMLCHVTLCYIMLRQPPMLPYGMEGCPGGEDMRHQPLQEPMPHHPTPEPLGDGA
jgi:hypothetical protein